MRTPSALGPLDLEGIDVAFEDLPDLHAELARLRRARPYAIVPFAGTKAVLLLTHELVGAAFRDEETFPAAATYSLSTGPVLGKTLQCMAGAEHRAYRTMVSPPFRKHVVEGFLERVLEPLAHELVDRFEGRGSADLVAELTTRYPVLLICRLLGLPVEDEATVHRWAHDLFTFPMDPDGARRASRELTEFVRPILARRRLDPGDDLISLLVTQTAEGEVLDDEQVLSFVRLLFPAGADTTMLGLGNTLWALLTHPEQLDALGADPAGIAPWATWEGLRWEPPVGLLPRMCPEDTTWHGIDIPAGTPMIFSVNAALRDPAEYPDPDRFDLSRREMCLLAFGQGRHSCIGMWLALAELTTVLTVLVERLPGLRLQAGGADAVRVVGQVGTALRGPTALPVEWG